MVRRGDNAENVALPARYERGMITVTALLVLSSSVVIYLAVQSVFISHKALLGKYNALQKEEQALKTISAQLIPQVIKSGAVPPWFTKQHAAYEIFLQDHSGKIHASFVHKFWFNASAIGALFENKEDEKKEAFTKFLELREAAGVTGDYAPYLTEKTSSFLTLHALVNVNADSFIAIEKLLVLNGVEKKVVKAFLQELGDNDARENYLNPQGLQKLFKKHNIPHFFLRIFVAEPIININAVPMKMLPNILKLTPFEITNYEEALRFITRKREAGISITIQDMRKNIITHLDDQFFFKIFTDKSSVYETRVCGNALCHSSLVMRVQKDTEKNPDPENTFWKVVEDRIERK